MRSIFQIAVCLLTGTLGTGFCTKIAIHDHGFWQGEDAVKEHLFDQQLANALVQFFQEEKAQNIVDFGCGTGDYVKTLLKHFDCEGYDGNPDTFKISNGLAHVVDLSQPCDLGKFYDWVLSLEVGEHLPKQYETIFIENLIRHSSNGIILSWAVKGQPGFGHFNCQNNDYIKGIMTQYGYFNDVESENKLRRQAKLPWFKNTIMVFRKI